MKCDKIGLLLSHVYISEGEDFKNEWIKSAIQKYDELDLNFYKVICGHGKRLKQEIASWFDRVYWENEIPLTPLLGNQNPSNSLIGK